MHPPLLSALPPPRGRDTYSVVLRQLHLLSGHRLVSLDGREARRQAALLMVVEAAINVGGVTRTELRGEGEEGDCVCVCVCVVYNYTQKCSQIYLYYIILILDWF